jgi:2-methylcitrate dehydratase PrpD
MDKENFGKRPVPVARRLAEEIVDSTPENDPRAARIATRLVLDIAGLCIAARSQAYVRSAIASLDQDGPCTVIGHAHRFGAEGAAFVNGIAAHGEDFDDTYEGGPVHAGVVIVPALLAAAERHGLSGQDLLRGIAVGAETMCRLCKVAPMQVHKAGFHPTAIFGVMGAAAGIGAALRLPAAELTHAFGIAGSMASGIIEYLADGSWTKRMHPGWAAQAGYRAVRLARSGFQGPGTVFEGEHGLFKGFANTRDGNFDAMLDGFGAEWLWTGIAFKPYACGTMTHPYVDCAREFRKKGIPPQMIERIECETAQGIVHRLWEPIDAKRAPPNGYAAKFSTPYAIAVGILRGDAGLREYNESVVHSRDVQQLAGKVSYVIDPDNPYPDEFTGHMRVVLNNGEVHEHRQGYFRGGTNSPLSDAEISAKFLANCAYGELPRGQAEAIAECVASLFTQPAVDLAACAG